MKEFEGRTGIVTGGSSGIGYAIANTLAQAGAKVYAISRSGAVKSGMAPSAEGVIHVRGDVTDGARMRIETVMRIRARARAGVSA
ncbi:MAG: SDR family NAD(P)-dependent oxidoreductase [Christensenellales bacterium]